MELKHKFTVPAPVDKTWAMFNDLEAIAPCFPGAALTSAEGDEFAGTVKVKLGPVSLQYSGTGKFLERDEDSHTARFEAKGKDKRGNGTAAANVVTVLLPDGSGTAVDVSTDLSVTGKPAQFGRGLMQDVSDKLLAQFVDCLSGKLSGEPEQAAAAPQAGAPEPAGEPQPAGPGPGGTSAGPSPAGTTATGGAQSSSGASPTGPATAPADGTRATATPPAAELDLGATVLPVLAKRYGPPALVALAVLLLLRRLLRR